MCGIAGCIDPTHELSREALNRMADSIVHRGPDDSGLYVSEDGRAGLAFRRLSIIDLSEAGHQPMASVDGKVHVVFNGEIYNFLRLKDELIRLGHRFRSKSDSEVLLHSYLEWGENCVNRLSGMFAFAILDERNNSIFLARDRTGIKPLFYYYDGKRFLFGSEIKAIRSHGGLNLEYDESAMIDFLAYLYIPAPKTIFKNLFKLPAGHTMSVTSRGLEIKEYWDIDPFKRIKITEKEAEEEIRRLLNEAVASHLMSDVPLGVFLSGGIDSSAVTALSQRLVQEPIKSFSIGFDVEEHSELGYAEKVANHVGTSHNTRQVDRLMFGEIADFIIDLYDEPYGDSSAIPTYFVSKFAREQVTVALSGDGGDEVFGGYNVYPEWIASEKKKERRIPAIQNAVDCIANRFPPTLRGYHRLKTAALRGLDYYGFLMGGFNRSDLRAVLDHDLLRKFKDYDIWWYFRKYWKQDLDDFTRLQYLDFKTYLPDDILTKVDRASMAVSLETRVPLLDHALVEFVFSLPPEIRLGNGQLKQIFKKALAGILPEEILYRKKKGFSIPGGSWMPPGSFTPGRDWSAQKRFLNRKAFESGIPWIRGNQLWQLRVLHKYLANEGVGS